MPLSLKGSIQFLRATLCKLSSDLHTPIVANQERSECVQIHKEKSECIHTQRNKLIFINHPSVNALWEERGWGNQALQWV